MRLAAHFPGDGGSGNSLWLGTNPGFNEDFLGLMDDVFVYDLVALGCQHQLEALPESLVVIHDQDSLAHGMLIGERGLGVRSAGCSRTAPG